MPSYHGHRVNNTTLYSHQMASHVLVSGVTSFSGLRIWIRELGSVRILVSTERCITLGDGFGSWKEAIYMEIYSVSVRRISKPSTDYVLPDGTRRQ
jgi:hypothetical protein